MMVRLVPIARAQDVVDLAIDAMRRGRDIVKEDSGR
jgi:hypothetical protein